jgi:hypothetical protein
MVLLLTYLLFVFCVGFYALRAICFEVLRIANLGLLKFVKIEVVIVILHGLCTGNVMKKHCILHMRNWLFQYMTRISNEITFKK